MPGTTGHYCSVSPCRTPLTPRVCGFSFHQQPVLQYSRHQLDVLQFSSILTLITWSKNQIPQGKSSVPQDSFHFRCRSQDFGLQYFGPTGCNLGIPTTPSSGSIICQNGSRNSGKHLTDIYQFVITEPLLDIVTS